MQTASKSNAAFQVGDRVTDRGGLKGTVAGVTHFEDMHWYDVRFERGISVRYDCDLTHVA